MARAEQRLGPYRLLRRIGAGGMGVVYEAIDDERGLRVALKTLPRLSPRALYRFKREFRSVADVVHPNLVKLYELMEDAGTWFFTMELVDGVDFLTYLRQEGVGGSERMSSEASTKLRATFRQLGEGVAALHEAGLLHLDLKPANVLVERGGRVVVLDFGLVQPSTPADGSVAPHEDLAGSPSYLSPEQVSGQEPEEASDWYAVGLMLFEALIGDLPFHGSIWESLLARTRESAPRLSSLRPGIPDDLDELCRLFLKRDPKARPSDDDVLRRLGAPLEHATKAALIGRDAEAGALLDAYRRGAPDQPASIAIRGRSGIGKSALARHFLERIRDLDQPLILAGRCYERESVPYKAFDPLIDALARAIQNRPVEEQRRIFDGDAHLAARIFPVLRGCKGLSGVPPPPLGGLDPVALRRRAFVALKQIFTRLGAGRRVVLFIDDLQWGDADSAGLLLELLSPPDPAPLFVLTAFRDDEAAASPFLQFVRSRGEALGSALTPAAIDLGPLSLEDAAALSASLAGPTPDPDRSRRIAVEAAGNPLFIEALTRHATSAPQAAGADGPGLSLSDVVEARIAPLADGARRLLDVVAIAGRPLEQDLAIEAARVERVDGQAALAVLRAARLIRTRGPRGRDAVESYHDRIGASVVAGLDAPARRRIHQELAHTLEASRRAEPEHLAHHFHGAGEDARAAGYAEAAAERAEAVLAFDRAAELHGQAIAWGDAGPERRRELVARRAQALVNAGRSAVAAPLFLEAAEGAARGARRDRVRRAAESYLTAGLVDDGLAVIKPLLEELDVPYPRSSAHAVFAVAELLVRLHLRGVDALERRHQDHAASRDDLDRSDVCWSLGKGLVHVLPIQGTSFVLRSLLSALDTGDPIRVGRSLAHTGASLLLQPGPLARRGEVYLARAEALARATGDPYLQGTTLIWRAFGELFAGRWRAVIEHAERGLRLLQDRCTGVRWECVWGAGVLLLALDACGEIAAVEARAEEHLREAAERGDLYGQVLFTQYVAFCRIARGDTDGARRGARWVIDRWTHAGYTVQHIYSMRIEAYCDLYEGNPGAALTRFSADRRAIARSHARRVPMSRIDLNLLEARILLTAAEGRDGTAHLRSCEAIASRLDREHTRLEGRAHAALLRAGIAARRGERGRAIVALTQCAEEYERLGMDLYAACARRRRGEMAGDAGAVEGADAWMRARGIADPERWTRIFAPGFDVARGMLNAA